MNDLGLYLHLPFCRRKCTYCAFAISTDRSQEAAYVGALEREIARSPERAPAAAAVTTIFYGGGTPSLTAPANLVRIDSAVRKAFSIGPGPEVSLEANPEDITPESLNVWSAVGVNRLSVGIQSFVDEELYPLGRGHARSSAIRALEIAVRDGRFRVSADLILGLPGQTNASFEESLRLAIDCGAGHLSLYMLDLEEGSTLRRNVEAGRTFIPDDALTAAMYERAIELCGEAGLGQYEISNFARTGELCAHNLRYWRRQHYLGVGLGAHSFIGRRRFANSRDLPEYLRLISEKSSATVFAEELTAAEEREEKLFLALRQAEGVPYEDLVGLCGMEGTAWTERGIEEGWLVRRGEQIAFTPAGFLLSNDYISQLF